MKLKVGNNAIGRIVMGRNSWDFLYTKEQGIPVARKGYTPKEKGYGISTYVKRGVWCNG